MTLPDPLGDAVSVLAAGGLVAYPTETVWGLAADARSEPAMARLRRWKARGADAPVALLLESAAAAEALGFELGALGARLARGFWPGPLTLVVRPGPQRFARGVARDDGAVGLRCSSHPLAAALARRLAGAGVGPVTATSLNRHGEAEVRTAEAARERCDGSPDAPLWLAVEAAEAGGLPASTVVDVSGGGPQVLRWGALREPELEPVLVELAS